MRHDARYGDESATTVWWVLLCRAVEQETIRRATRPAPTPVAALDRLDDPEVRRELIGALMVRNERSQAAMQAGRRLLDAIWRDSAAECESLSEEAQAFDDALRAAAAARGR